MREFEDAVVVVTGSATGLGAALAIGAAEQGAKAVILEWTGKRGKVRVEGEIWKASSSHRLDLAPNDEVTIEAVEKLQLIVRA